MCKTTTRNTLAGLFFVAFCGQSLGACSSPAQQAEAIFEEIPNLVLQVIERRPDVVAKALEKPLQAIVTALRENLNQLANLERKQAPNPETVAALLEKNPAVLVRAIEKQREEIAKLLGIDLEKGAQTRTANQELPEIDPKRILSGPANAPVTLVAYSDFQCPLSAKAATVIRRILAKYKEKVRFLLKHSPHESHPGATPAAEYFEALLLQNPEKAYRFYERMFARQRDLDDRGTLASQVARRLALDPRRLEADRRSEAVNARITDDHQEAENLGFDRTPSFVINGEKLQGVSSFSKLAEVVERKLAEAAKKI